MSKANPTLEYAVFTSLKSVIDPELLINIIDLGLVYGVYVDHDPKKIIVEMTLTSKGCPLGEAITGDVRRVVTKNNPGYTVEVDLVWSPEWTIDKLTEEGRAELGRS